MDQASNPYAPPESNLHSLGVSTGVTLGLKHSGPGIASFATGLASGILLFVLVVVAGVLTASSPGGLDEKSPAAISIGCFIIALLFVEPIAIGLGIYGVIQKDRKKIFSVLGICIASSVFLIVLALMIIGFIAKSHA